MNDINDKYTHLLCFHVYLRPCTYSFLSEACLCHQRPWQAGARTTLGRLDSSRQCSSARQGRSKSSATENGVKRLSADPGRFLDIFSLQCPPSRAWRKRHRPAPLEMLYAKLLMERLSCKGLNPCHVQFALLPLSLDSSPLFTLNQTASGSQAPTR
jgi:hypothetical protein